MAKNSKKYLAGYRLHLKRLGFPNAGKSIRTIKYPLGDYDKTAQKIRFTEKEERFALKIKQDYETLYGSFNLTSYTELSQSPSEHYSLKDFYLDLLKAGVVMKHSAAKLLEDLRVITNEQEKIDDEQKRLMQEVNLDFFNKIDFEKFKKEVLKGKEIRSSKKSLGFFKENNAKTQKLAKNLLSTLQNKPRSEQNRHWQDVYGAKKSLYQIEGEGITFYLIPQIAFRGNQEIEPPKLLDLYEEDLSKCLKADKDINMEEFIGISDNQSGLSQAFGKLLPLLQNDELEAIRDDLMKMSDSLWQNKDSELNKRLEFLAKQSKKLSEPQLVKSWADYRTDFGGKIQSWVSNSLRQDGNIAKFLFGDVKKELKSTRYTTERTQSKAKTADRSGGNKIELAKVAKLTTDDLPEGRHDKTTELQEARELAEKLIVHLSSFEESYEAEKGFDFSFELLEDYRDVLAQLKIKLNLLYQSAAFDEEAKEQEDTKTKQKTADKIYKSLFGNLPKMPSFIGDTKTGQDGIYAKYLESKSRVDAGINFLMAETHKDFQTLIGSEAKEKRTERLKSCLQGVLNLYRRTGNSSSQALRIMEKILETFVAVKSMSSLRSNKPDYYIFQSKYKHRRGGKDKQIALKHTDAELINQTPVLLKLLSVKWDIYRSTSEYLNQWLALMELEKMRIGLLTQTYDVSEVVFSKELKEYFPKINIILRRFSPENQNSSKTINEVIQQAILSEMRGTISKMTTSSMIMRYVVQPMESENKFDIMTDASSYGHFNNKNPRYFINIAKNENDNLEEDRCNLYSFKDKPINKDVLSKKSINKNQNNLLQISSSRYQLQFLDNALSGRWSEFEPTISSYSFIYEERVDISWSDDSQKPTIKTIGDSRSLFVSIPFQLTGSDHDGSAQLGDNFLGIDMGEYGLATCVLNTANLKQEPPTSFIHSRPLRKIKEGITSNVGRQKAGIFSMPNTYVKRLRQDAITSIRNRVHWLIISHRAIPVYEANVSNFETKSGKISKIYNSVKQSDIYRQEAANRLERALVWGKRGNSVKKNLAEEISAFATSYSCSKCKKSIYALDMDKSVCKIAEVIRESSNGRTLKIQSGKEYILGFFSSAHLKNKKVGDSLKPEDVIKAARHYARPPYKDNFHNIFSEQDAKKIDAHYKKHGLEAKNTSTRSDKIPNTADKARDVLRHYAGSQAIFRCPFANCNHIADADLQAALWVALKGYLKHIYKIGNPNEVKNKMRDLTTNEKAALKIAGVSKKGDSIHIPLEGLLKFAKQADLPDIQFVLSQRLMPLK